MAFSSIAHPVIDLTQDDDDDEDVFNQKKQPKKRAPVPVPVPVPVPQIATTQQLTVTNPFVHTDQEAAASEPMKEDSIKIEQSSAEKTT